MIAKLRNLILPIEMINKSLPQAGLIYEIGSGHGGLAYHVALFSEKRRVIGIDVDKAKGTWGDRPRLSNLELVIADATNYAFKACQGAVMSDFLHHVDYNTQEKILKKVRHKMSPDSVLVIKEIDDAGGWRKWLSRLWDLLLYPRDTIYYRSRRDWTQLLTSLGFSVTSLQTVKWFPGSTILYVARRKKT